MDKEDNKVNAAYAGWPDRMVVIGADGKVAYYGGKGPQGFKPQEVERWLQTFRDPSAAREKPQPPEPSENPNNKQIQNSNK